MNKITSFAGNQEDISSRQLVSFGTSHDRVCNSVIHSGTPTSRCYSNSRSYIDFLFEQHLHGNLTPPPHQSRGFNWACYCLCTVLFGSASPTPHASQYEGQYDRDSSPTYIISQMLIFMFSCGLITCVTCNDFNHKLYYSEMVLPLFIKRTQLAMVLIFINIYFQYSYPVFLSYPSNQPYRI